MSFWKKLVSVALIASVSAPIAAQNAAEQERAEAAARAERTQRAATAERAEQARQVELRMREAERQLEEAAQRIAELSADQLARVGEFGREWVVQSNRPAIGITIGMDGEDEPVEGVSVIGITPGSAAEEAGLRSGDIITAVNDESLSSSSADEANRKLLDFMQGVEEGDVLDIEYLRDNKSGSVELAPKVVENRSFDFRFGRNGYSVPVAPSAPRAPSVFAWVQRHGGYGFGDMEMVELNDSLGRYFGTDSGLLIVKAPEDNAFELQDGDVIKSIDGRSPKDLHHAIRILRSYQSGETVNIEIMRDKRKKTITIEVPDNRQSLAIPDERVTPVPTLAPAPMVAPDIVVVPKVRVLRKAEERT